ncbi:DUF1761 domain-containing protein [Litoribacillus peritrichatus]|uniref:DUF1761 domain-containing protein n=1 Tax=Litoribacillus peritrichatus TaxID=718191 RepID=A0ABP7MF91_9GAMM
MSLDINLIAVFAAAIATFLFGALWYSPLLFLEAWAKEAAINTDQNLGSPVRVFGLTFLSTLFSSAMLSLVLYHETTAWFGALKGAGVGAFFVMASLGINYQFAQCSFKQWLIDGGFHVGRFAIMGFIIGGWLY